MLTKNKKAIRPLAAAASALNNKTGSWRTHKPIIDPKICVGCSLCAKLCPDACIAMSPDENGKMKALVDYDYCKGCGVCAAECPVKAIMMAKDY
jgi:pyruvate ferredoxin oxidoreductase delta subunit